MSLLVSTTRGKKVLTAPITPNIRGRRLLLSRAITASKVWWATGKVPPAQMHLELVTKAGGSVQLINT